MTNIAAGTPGIGQMIAGAAATGGAGGIRGGSSAGDRGSWYEAMSRAWGQTLDSQAAVITDMSANIGAGDDQPSSMVQLTAASLKMQFMSNNASTSQNSVGQALETLGKRG
ncbi:MULTISPECIES: hypothetical protein [unclassified Luteimonas]|uniref:hypothetical protein n=1 Tax=unclassified Luteimonas TaxID=2629088 RepID=UPI0018F097DE|nr:MULTISPECIES: hypothetical protein [unclassified Luteimonas]MBJ6979137.1 hypothetical protein [Luteimonas sp. MC1895]MBJ6985153.1 hypothetical protein [Luteimonas sp. MC1750]QQO05809.1 hypothetical protein JGR68_13535 [Luteimonas sp. MC1750]